MRKWGSIAVCFALACAAFLGGCAQQASSPSQQSNQPNAVPQTESSQETTYPTGKINLIVPFAAGGGTDAVGRAFAESLKSVLGVDVIVVNRTGGSGAIGMNEGLQAKPDGYTLTMVAKEVVTLPLLGTAPFQTMDFTYIANINIDPTAVVVPVNSKYQTIDNLLAEMKANPNKLKFAASAVPNPYGLMLSKEAGVNFITVPYQGAAPAITELLGGGADFGIYSPGEVKAHVEGGNLRVLAVTSEERFAGYKDAPTLKEKGYNVITGTYRGIAVPPGVPAGIVKKLEEAAGKAVQNPDFVEFMNKSFLGLGYKNATDFKSMIESDIKSMGPIIELMKTQKQ